MSYPVINIAQTISGLKDMSIVTPQNDQILSYSNGFWKNMTAIILSRLTTTERDLLTPVNGMLIYNTTINRFQGYEDSVWTNLGDFLKF